MLAAIATLLDVAQKLFGLRGVLSQAKKNRKVEVADFLGGIAQVLEETSASLRGGVYPHGACQQLLVFAQAMEAAIGDLIGAAQASVLSQSLLSVWQIEQLFGQLGSLSSADRETNLAALDQAAGLFRATSAVVRVSP